MNWASLQLWSEDEEKRIHDCLVEALRQLIATQSITSTAGELKISGKLRPHLYRTKKKQKLAWTLQFETSSFEHEYSPKPYGHPDIRFSYNTPDHDQYDYDVECKLVRVKREGKAWDYCQHYVVDGVKRFLTGKYAQSIPPRGAMIGYVQAGENSLLLDWVNRIHQNNQLEELMLHTPFAEGDVTRFLQKLDRASDICFLTHLWADLRYLLELERQEIDRQFEAMADDDAYQAMNEQLSESFAESDWDALIEGETE